LIRTVGPDISLLNGIQNSIPSYGPPWQERDPHGPAVAPPAIQVVNHPIRRSLRDRPPVSLQIRYLPSQSICVIHSSVCCTDQSTIYRSLSWRHRTMIARRVFLKSALYSAATLPFQLASPAIAANEDKVAVPKPTAPQVEVVFCLDTTGSMG